MKRVTVILRENEKVEGINVNTTLKGFRKQLKDKGYTEVNTIYRSGRHIVTFLTENVDRLNLIDAGLIRGSKKEREDYKLKTKDIKSKFANFGYTW